MVKVEARLVAAAAGAPPIWVQTLERDAKATLARVAGIDDGEGGLTTWGLAVAGVPELESRNLSSRGWHASFHWDGTHLTVARRMIPPTTNGLLTTDGKAAPDEIRLKPGESFRIARFHFTVVAGYPPSNEWDASIPPELTAPLKPRGRDGNRSNEVVRSEEEVLKTPLVDSDRVIAGLLDIVDRFDPATSSEKLDDLFRQAVRRAVPCDGAAADVVDVPPLGTGDPKPRGKEIIPRFSRTFVRDAITKVGPTGGVLAGVWRNDNASIVKPPGLSTTGMMSTVSMPGWAVCAPVPSRNPGEDAIVLYVSAPLVDPSRAIDPATDPGIAQAQKVVLLFAKLYAALNRVTRDDARYREMRRFLPGPVRGLMNRPDYAQKLAPRKLDVTVIFCDLRGSCGVADEGKNDLKSQWDNVFKEALEQMSQAIVDNDGVIGGFIGDAVMGFWGWPDELAPASQVRQAARAALAIRRNFDRLRKKPNSLLAKLRIGIGLTHGPALVGKLGNYDMDKIDVFGPTVNRAARLEGLTKRLGVEVLVDEFVAKELGDGRAAGGRLRRVARIAPAGMDVPFDIHELLPPETDGNPGATAWICNQFAQALGEFEAGWWENARLQLEPLLAQDDGPSRFLTTRIGNLSTPPEDAKPDAAGYSFVKDANDVWYIRSNEK